jgi:hypothetical protein
LDLINLLVQGRFLVNLRLPPPKIQEEQLEFLLHLSGVLSRKSTSK